MSICHSGRGAVFIMAAASLFPSLASAIVSINDEIELEGFLQARNILRTPRFEDAEFIMQRNTAQIEGKYYFLKDSTAFGRFDTGRLEYATFSFVGRSVYDSIYDVRESYDDSFPSYQDQPGDFEAKLREAYVDLVLPPFSLRLGKQQVVWGKPTTSARWMSSIHSTSAGIGAGSRGKTSAYRCGWHAAYMT